MYLRTVYRSLRHIPLKFINQQKRPPPQSTNTKISKRPKVPPNPHVHPANFLGKYSTRNAQGINYMYTERQISHLG